MSLGAETPLRASSLLAADQCLDEILAAWVLLSDRHGLNLLHAGREEIGRSSVDHRNRLYVKHQFIDADNPSADPINVFLKYSDNGKAARFVHDFEAWLGSQTLTGFSVPGYYGQLRELGKSIGASIGVWEYTPMDAMARHAFRRQDVRSAVVKAAAAMTTMSEEARRAVPALPPTPTFIKPVAERLGSLADAAGYFGLGRDICLEQLSKLAALEQPAIYRLNDLGGYLTHNDLQPKNFLLRENQLVIYDWESVSLGPPGASLYRLTKLETAELLDAVDHYCKYLAAGGVLTTAKNVLFALQAWSIFRMLDRVASDSRRDLVKSKGRLRWALSSVDLLRCD